MNTITRNYGEIKMEYRNDTITFRPKSPQLPPLGMKLVEAIAAAKATLQIAAARLSELSEDSLCVEEADELRQALYPDITLEMSQDEYVDYLDQLRTDGLHDGVSAHWGHD